MKASLWTKALALSGLFAILSTGAVVGAAKGTWTITSVTVGAHGSWSSYGDPNLKKTNSNYASFNGDAEPSNFGYRVRLINSKAQWRSDQVELIKNKTRHAGNNSGKKRYYYYSDVRSKFIEPNRSRVKLHFSSDYK